MEKIKQVLPQHPFFVGLSRRSIERVASCGREQTVEGGTALFYAGDYADTLYLVLKGRIELRIHRRAGSSVVLDTVTGGDVVGWSWLVEPRRWMFDAIAVQDTDLLALDGNCLRSVCDDDPAFGYAFLTRVTELLRHRLDLMRKLLAEDAYGGRDGRS